MNKIYHLVITVTEDNPEYSEKAETDFLEKQRYSSHQFLERPTEAKKTRERDCLRADVGQKEFEGLKRALVDQIGG